MIKTNLICKSLFVILLCLSNFVFADDTVFIEEMTTQEVTEAINSGKKAVIIFSGSTEQNGPQIVLGKHNYMAHYFANAIARELGNALVYPIFPFAPTGDPVSRSGHMAYSGSISLREESYKSVIQDLVVSAISSGFKTILLMGDHGDSQEQLKLVADSLNKAVQPYGIKVLYIDSIYTVVSTSHASHEDASMLMAIDYQSKLVKLINVETLNSNKISDFNLKPSVDEGIRLNKIRIRAAVKQIKSLTSQ
jgi:creatinine amidohydrolase/Fe(II)-dependent formamide hydrolase-like protein